MSNPGDKFPERNLPGSAENWGREIEKRIENAEKLLGATSRSVRNAQRAVSGQASTIENQIASVVQAKESAEEAQISADGKNRIWYLPEAPEPPEGVEPVEYFKVGDTWFDTDDGNKIYEWETETDEEGIVTGSWVAIEFGAGAIADGAIDGDKIAQEVNDAIQDAVSDSSEAKSIAESAVVDTYDEYATSNDPEDPPTAGWSTDTPPWSPGTYIWRRNVVTYGNGTTVTGLPVMVTGNPGSSGTGVIGSSVTYQTSTSATTPPGGTWGEDVPPVAPGEYLWTRTIITYSDSTSTTLYSVGGAGTEGVGIESSEAQYTTSTNGTTPPSSGWQTTIPTVPPGHFLWTRMTVTFTDNTVQESYSVARAGADGADGRGIVSTAVSYAVSSSGTSTPSSGWQGTVPSVPAGQYLWTRTVITYTSGDPSTTYSVARQGQDGSPGAPGTDGRGVASSTTHYAVSSSGTTTPSSGWQTSIPSVPEGQFLWTRITWTFTSGPDHVTYSVARSGEDGAPGAPGSPGAPGADGRGVSSVTQFYWMGTSAPSTPTVSPPPSPWTTTEPTYTGGTQNLYGTVRTIYSSGSPNFTYSPVSLLASFQAAKTAYNLADSAMTLAGTKTKVLYSTSAPSGSAETNDVWRRQDGSGNIIGEWRYTGSGWQQTQLTNTVISNLDAGKITTGELEAARVKMDEAFVNKMAANKILVSGDNLIKNTDFMGGGWTRTNGQNSVVFAPITGPSGKPAVVATASSSTTYAAYYAGTTSHNPDWVIPVNGAEEFRATVWVYSATAIPANKVGIGVVRYTEAYVRSAVATYYPSSIPADTWIQVSVTLTTVSNNRSIGLYFPVNNGHSSDIYFSDPELVRKATGELIVDGSITAQKMLAGTITAASGIIADAAITSAKISDLAVTNAKIANGTIQNAKIANLDAAKITSGSFEGKSFTGGTFTGSLVRTASSGQRFEMSAAGFRGFDDQGINTVTLYPETGGLTVRGTSGGSQYTVGGYGATLTRLTGEGEQTTYRSSVSIELDTITVSDSVAPLASHARLDISPDRIKFLKFGSGTQGEISHSTASGPGSYQASNLFIRNTEGGIGLSAYSYTGGGNSASISIVPRTELQTESEISFNAQKVTFPGDTDWASIPFLGGHTGTCQWRRRAGMIQVRWECTSTFAADLLVNPLFQVPASIAPEMPANAVMYGNGGAPYTGRISSNRNAQIRNNATYASGGHTGWCEYPSPS